VNTPERAFVRPKKKPSEMTDEEIDQFASDLAAMIREKLEGTDQDSAETAPPTSQSGS
jgi:hypothetical protein